MKYFGIHLSEEGAQFIVVEYMNKGSAYDLVSKEQHDLSQLDLVVM